MTEWTELKDLQAVAAAQARGEEMHYCHKEDCDWHIWNGNQWDADWIFRSRPAKKTKTIVLREGLYQSLIGEYWTTWTNAEAKMIGNEKFVKWLDTPERIVEVEES